VLLSSPRFRLRNSERKSTTFAGRAIINDGCPLVVTSTPLERTSAGILSSNLRLRVISAQCGRLHFGLIDLLRNATWPIPANHRPDSGRHPAARAGRSRRLCLRQSGRRVSSTHANGSRHAVCRSGRAAAQSLPRAGAVRHAVERPVCLHDSAGCGSSLCSRSSASSGRSLGWQDPPAFADSAGHCAPAVDSVLLFPHLASRPGCDFRAPPCGARRRRHMVLEDICIATFVSGCSSPPGVSA